MNTRRISRRRLRRALISEMWLRRVPAALAVVGLFVLGGWLTASQWDWDMARCLHAYDRARTAADTARVDGIPRGGKYPRNGPSCGRLRRDGTLDRHRAAMARARSAALSGGHSVIKE